MFRLTGALLGWAQTLCLMIGIGGSDAGMQRILLELRPR